MNISTYFHETDQASIRMLIGLYSNGKDSEAVLFPPKTNEDGTVSLLGGRPLTDTELGEICVRALQRKSQTSVLGPNVLAVSEGRIAWWAPVQHRVVFFQTSDKEFDADCNGKRALWPPLVFVAVRGKGLSVFALAANERPCADTELMVAPCFNMYEGGRMCQGSVPMPSSPSLDNTEAYERAFFDSTFGHGNRIGLTSYPYGGHNGLWRNLCSQTHKCFPFQWLVPAISGKEPVTLAKAVAQ